MRVRATWGAVLLFWGTAARAQFAPQYWDAQQNTNGMCAVPVGIPAAVMTQDTSGAVSCDTNFKWDTLNAIITDNVNGVVSYSITNSSNGANAGAAFIVNNDTGSAEMTLFSSTAALSDDLLIRGSGHAVVIQAPSVTNGMVELSPGNGVTRIDNLAGVGTRCVQTDASGDISPAAGACGGGSVTAVSATAPLFITGGASPTPNVVGHDLIFGGDTTTGGQNLGSISTAPLGCVTSGGKCVVDGLTLAGGLSFNTATGVESLGSFTCGANTFVSSSSTSGLACTQPAFSNLSGSLACGQLPAFTGDLSSAGGTCSVNVTAIQDAGTVRGTFTVKQHAAPSAPSGSDLACWNTVGGTGLACMTSSGIGSARSMVPDVTCGSNTFVSSASSGTLSCTRPTTGDLSGWPAATDILVSAGASVAPVGDSVFTYDTTNHVEATPAIGVNGVSVPTNAELVTGHSTNADRDRDQFFLGGGALGATGAGDNTLFEIIPSATNIRSGVTAGIYSTVRIENLTWTGVSSPTITEADSLYIDGAPTVSAATSAGSTPNAIHVKSGTTFLEGNVTVNIPGGTGGMTLGLGPNGGNVSAGDFGFDHGVTTGATTDFMWISTCSGTPGGTPANLANRGNATPVVYDRLNDVLYVWNAAAAAWKAH